MLRVLVVVLVATPVTLASSAPREQELAFTVALRGSPPAVCVGSLSDLAHVRRLTGLRYAETAWSPDGKRLALTGGKGRTNPIRVERADGTKLRALTSPRLATESDSNATWSPDGKSIAFSRYVYYGRHTDYRRFGVWTVNVVTGRETHLTLDFGGPSRLGADRRRDRCRATTSLAARQAAITSWAALATMSSAAAAAMTSCSVVPATIASSPATTRETSFEGGPVAMSRMSTGRAIASTEWRSGGRASARAARRATRSAPRRVRP